MKTCLTFVFLFHLVNLPLVAASALNQQTVDDARVLLNDWDQPERRALITMLGESALTFEAGANGDFFRLALIGANIELATKKNDLQAFNYVLKRLSVSQFPEERGDIVGKLSAWPGSEKLAHAVLPALLNAAMVDEDDQVRYLILIGLKRMIDRDPSLVTSHEASFENLRKSLSGDKKALRLLGEK